MATPETVKAKINNLISLANEKTGETDADLTTAVNRLAEGYGSGSGGGDTSGSVETCTVVIQADESVDAAGGYFNVAYQYLTDDGNIEFRWLASITDGYGMDKMTGEEIGGLPLTLNNVLCNRIMAFGNHFGSEIGYYSDDGDTLSTDFAWDSSFAYIPLKPNSTNTLTFGPW